MGPLHLGCNREVAALLRWLLTFTVCKKILQGHVGLMYIDNYTNFYITLSTLALALKLIGSSIYIVVMSNLHSYGSYVIFYLLGMYQRVH